MSAELVLGLDPIRFLARITIEARAAMLIGDGIGTPAHDATFVRDVHGLPAIPGTTLTGVLSHALAHAPELSDASHHDVFGQVWQGPASSSGARTTASLGSRLSLSDAVFHDAADRPVPQKPGVLDDDDVIRLGRSGVVRDRVRIGPRGSADGRGKFDAQYCPAGARFTFEMELAWGAPSAGYAIEDETTLAFEEGERVWTLLLHHLSSPLTRLGRQTRSGFGAFTVIGVEEGVFWLPKTNRYGPLARPARADRSLDDYVALPARLGAPAKLAVRDLPDGQHPDCARIELTELKPEATWIFGGGTPTGEEDIAPREEPVIRWEGSGTDARGRNLPGQVVRAHVVPGSSVKGAIAHRTLWHLNRRLGNFLDAPADEGRDNREQKARQAFESLFGAVKLDEAVDEDGSGQAGKLFFDDVYLTDEKTRGTDQNFMHIVNDPFTSGVRKGLLFEERVQLGGRIVAREGKTFKAPEILIDRRAGTVPDRAARLALRDALQDLALGWLPLGAAAARGHGVFTAEIQEDASATEWFSLPDSAGEYAA